MFFRPIEFCVPILKSEESEGRWILKGPTSSERKDRQNDIILFMGISKGMHRFIERQGYIDWEHLSFKQRDPDYVIGRPLQIYEGPALSKGMTIWLDSELDKDNTWAQKAWNLKQKGHPLWYSVGGHALSKSLKTGAIDDTDINHMAVTMYPANPDAKIVEAVLTKSLESGEGWEEYKETFFSFPMSWENFGKPIYNPKEIDQAISAFTPDVNNSVVIKSLSELESALSPKSESELTKSVETLLKVMTAGGVSNGSRTTNPVVPEDLEGSTTQPTPKKRRRRRSGMYLTTFPESVV